MGIDMSNIADMSMNKNSNVSSVRVDDYTTELSVIASNDVCLGFRPAHFILVQSTI